MPWGRPPCTLPGRLVAADRKLARLGHHVRLIPAQYVKPFVKRAKNDRADAEAISDAADHALGRGQVR